MMKESEDGGVYPWSQWTAGGLLCAAARGLLRAAARGAVCGGVKEKKKDWKKKGGSRTVGVAGAV